MPQDPEIHILVYVSRDLTANPMVVCPAHIHWDGKIPQAVYKDYTSSYVWAQRRGRKERKVISDCADQESRLLVANWI